MTFLEERDFTDVPLIPEYFKQKTVFITGGSGFLGKVLIEKLLYSCSELERIYILLRTKRGLKPEDRKNQLYNFACFDRLRSEKPGLFESKVFIIPGDISEPNLGMSMEDRAFLVNKINIIFHSAASVRFDDTLKVASKLNLLGTKQILDLAKDVHDLDCFVHVSTAYSNKLYKPIEEKLYPPVMNWRELLELCEIDDHTMQVLTPKLLNGMANTYVLTKHLAEHMVYEEKGNLPIVIVRPSIVSSSFIEPVLGWNDNFNGPIGIILAMATGLSSTLFAEKNIKSDYIPVDLVVKSMICSAWVRGTKKLEPSDNIPIYNACAIRNFHFSPSEIYFYGISAKKSACKLLPLESVILPPRAYITTSWFMFNVYLCSRLFLYVFLDLIFKLLSKQQSIQTTLKDMILRCCYEVDEPNYRLVKLIRRIYNANMSVQVFSLNEWTFDNTNFIKLCSILKEGDINEFNYKIESTDKFKYIYNCLVGCKKYLLKEKMENLPTAKLINNRVKYYYMGMKIIFFAFMVWYIFSSHTMKTYVAKIIKF